MPLTPRKTQRLAQRGGISPLVPRLPQPLSRDLTRNRMGPNDEIARRRPLGALGSDAATRMGHQGSERSTNGCN